MLEKFDSHIKKKFPFIEGKKLLIAISGGIDSVVLTYLLKKLNHQVFLAHCNFQLRDNESDLDEKFVLELGKKLDIKTFSTKFDTKDYAEKNKLSVQIAARELRYAFFDKLVEENNLDFTVTAHHADDNLETFLINLTRKTGLEGLTGIPEKNNNIIRPLLPFSREQIHNFAKQNAINWREDQSNSETKYIRNKIRHEVIPILKEINPSLLESFNQTTEFLDQSSSIVSDRIEMISKEIISFEKEHIKFDVQKIKALNNPKAYLYYFLKDYGFKEWNNVEELLSSQSGKQLENNEYILFKDRDFLLLTKKEKFTFRNQKVYQINNNNTSELEIPFKIHIENTTKTKVVGKKTILVDKNLVFYPLILRQKKDGDFFYPTGMTGKKKVSKFFKDEKLSALDKNNVWLLCDSNDQVIWIIGKRQDRRFTINSKTKSIVKISI